MSGLTPDLEFIATGMVSGAMGLCETMRSARDTAIAMGQELSRQRGMVGDDDAGHHFAKVYVSAARTTLDQIGFSAHVLGETGRGLMRNAREFMATESAVVAAFLGKQVDLTASMGDPGEDCPQQYLGLGQELPEVVGDTSWWDQYAPGGRSDRFRGSPERLRDVAGCWRRGGELMVRFLEDAQAHASTASKAHSGEAAESFHTYFRASVGLGVPPQQAQSDEPLVMNLIAACNQLAKACDRYADHVEDAKLKIQFHKDDPLTFDMPWHQPVFGGNGYDGGLKDAVTGDPYIQQLGDVAHALDSSQSRIKLPRSSGGPGLPGLPFLPPLPAPAPAPFALASYRSGLPGIMPALFRNPDPNVPWRAPIPPSPVPPPALLTPSELASFTNWVNTLTPAGLAGSPDPARPENAYQLRVAGYPERIVPLSGPGKSSISADGMRAVDGMMVDAKYVKGVDDDCKKSTFRKMSTFDIQDEYKPNGELKRNKKNVLIGGDKKELIKYRQAIREHSELRGLEIITNDKEAVPYWQTLMAMEQVKGAARYVR
ncbi:restriction endonuclease fold toxin-2 domain-containing protein [Streptomyces sp. YS-3]|uniref:restriction endonuclease fold toxin-2 domain-containing protein n=1 Tax=Streptomyces sp. YS-3 TaxID=3381352 RepID=UPI00386256F2